MKTAIIAASLALGLATTALAQAPAPAAPAAAAAAPASGKLSVQTSKISEIIKNPAAKAALEKTLPDIAQYYDQIGDMTLAEIVPMAGGAITEEHLKTIQADFDKLG